MCIHWYFLDHIVVQISRKTPILLAHPYYRIFALYVFPKRRIIFLVPLQSKTPFTPIRQQTIRTITSTIRQNGLGSKMTTSPSKFWLYQMIYTLKKILTTKPGNDEP